MDLALMEAIEGFIVSYLSAQAAGDKPRIYYQAKAKWSPVLKRLVLDEDSKKLSLTATSVQTARLFRVLEICYTNLSEDSWCTKRLYLRNKD